MNFFFPFGNDFRFQNASVEFDNMDFLMGTVIDSKSNSPETLEYINNHSDTYGVQMMYRLTFKPSLDDSFYSFPIVHQINT